MSRGATRLFTITPGTAFLSTCVDALLAGEIIPGVCGADDPAWLANATIFVPTQRSARALADEFVRASKRNATILPKIVPLGRLEDAETSLAISDDEIASAESVPEAVGDIERRLALSRLIIEWAQRLGEAVVSIDETGRPSFIANEPLLVGASPLQAWRMSADLAGLIDDMIIENVPWDALQTLAPEEYDHYWRITLEFLKIATGYWPQWLQEKRLLDRAERQKQLVDAEIARLAALPANRIVLAIGSTGANRATARLLGAIAAHQRGAVVLPGLDLTLDARTWESIKTDSEDHNELADGHPQAVMRRFLNSIGANRADVVELGKMAPALRERARFISEAMRPAETTDAWIEFAQAADETLRALDGISIIEAADEREEALCLAIEARRLLEFPGATGALITPDRALAKRVKSELARWNVEVEDSAGEAFGATPMGVLARLVLAAADDFGPVEILALLSHPLVRLKYERQQVERLTGLIEAAVFRAAPWSREGFPVTIAAARIAASDRSAHPLARAISEADWLEIEAFAEEIERALQPLSSLPVRAELAQHIRAHRAALAAVCGPDFAAGSPPLETLLDALASASDPASPLGAADYAALLDSLMREATVKPRRDTHPRFAILGPLEARLLTFDVVLLGGLDEAVWPPAASTDAFLNRPMRAKLGLSAPERRIGQSAHDFVQAFGASRVVLSRALKRNGAPTVSSRFVQRIATLAGETEWRARRDHGAEVLRWARAIDVEARPPIERPAPKPPLELRPKSLSVTRIETLRRDPYSIYAAHILRLEPLAPLADESAARQIGNLLHELTAELARRIPRGALPADALLLLLQSAEKKFGVMLNDAEFRMFTWPRITKALAALVDWENGRRGDIERIVVEVDGRLAINLVDGSIFNLSGRADRVEIRKDGSLVVVDFKSGQPPSLNEVQVGFAPQLTLEAAMLAGGAFADVTPAKVADAIYAKVLAGEEIKVTSLSRIDAMTTLAAQHLASLKALLDQFRDVETPYIPRPFPQFASKYGDYDHLARVKEWSASGREGDAS